MASGRIHKRTLFRMVLAALHAQATLQFGSPKAIMGAECYKRYNESTTLKCPTSCDTISRCAAGGDVMCIKAEDCPIFYAGFAGNAVDLPDGGRTCASTDLAGCGKALSSTECLECQSHFSLNSDGSCSWRYYYVWVIVIGLLGLLVLWILVEFYCWNRQPNTNALALAQGLRHRSRAKVRDESKPNRPRYPLWSTNMHTTPICGPGMPLFMNWFVFIAFVAVWLILLSVIFGHRETPFDSVDKLCAALKLDDATGKLDVDPEMTKKYYENTTMTLWVVLSYVGTAVAFMLFLFMQCRLWHKMQRLDAIVPSIHRYAIEASGFPNEVPDYKELLEYWSHVLQALEQDADGVAEISVAYDYTAKEEEVNLLILEHLREEEDKYPDPPVLSKYAAEVPAWVGLEEEEDEEEEEDGAWCSCCNEDESDQELSDEHTAMVSDAKPLLPTDKAGPFWVQFFSFFTLGTNFDYGCIQLDGYTQAQFIKEDSEISFLTKEKALLTTNSVQLQSLPRGTGNELTSFLTAEEPQEEKTKQTIPEFLSRLKGSGTMTVVFKTLLQKRAVRDDWKPDDHLFRNKHRISVKQQYEEPQGVLWKNFGISKREHNISILQGVLIMTLILVVWGILYYPWFWFSKNAFGATSQVATLADIVAGLGIPLGNAMVAYGVLMVVDRYGFRHDGTRDSVYLYVLVPCMWLNVACDLLVTYWAAKQLWPADLKAGKHFMETFAVWTEGEELFTLLFPSYSLIPYVCEPVACVLLPFLCGIWRIKQDGRINPSYAEVVMAPAEIDIVCPPYGDLIVSTATFMWAFLNPTAAHFKIFCALLQFVVLLYFQNRVRILRWHATTYFGTKWEHVAVSYLWALPLALLAVPVSRQLFPQFRTRIAIRILIDLATFCLHVLLHVLFVKYAIRWAHDDLLLDTYDQVQETRRKDGKLTNYLNTNPIEVLKSQPDHMPNKRDEVGRYIVQPDVERLVMFQVGKERLQPVAPHKYHEDESPLEVSAIAKESVKDLFGCGEDEDIEDESTDVTG